ncbi:mechanosensitive ion channel family protein [Thiorhodovibrio frisius]|uniref:Small-conductance mechanosensitive channel n=1 Tax=Thiorhodovibrio frisius TaxID=631362 RepID=H8Z177_9GAMM|nr:mechanosensitive ion channel family protein [Thiorhodovibrio frisius]EIC21392.1 small-conductance mechanosensitive channel [Thiorhodovibrio frisius]WPL23978.1 MscS family inner membrane protein YnaI [Thiorhodovibrio frisius]
MEQSTAHQSSLFDALLDKPAWLLAACLGLFALWELGLRKLGGRGGSANKPGLVATLDLLLLPTVVILVGTLLRLAVEEFGIARAEEPLRVIMVFFFYMVLSWCLVRMGEVFLFEKRVADYRASVPGLLRALGYLGGLLGGVSLFMWQQGYSIAGVWVSTGVAAALAGFALQRPLGDLFAGIAMGLEQPFQIGDWIELPGDIVGRVVDINWRATWLQGWDNSRLIIPNSLLAGQNIKNYESGRRQFAPWYIVKVPAEVDPRFATALLLEAAMRAPHVLNRPLPVVRLANATSQPYEYMVWVHYDNYPAMFRGREELFREIHYAFLNAGIHISPQISEWRTRRADANTRERPSIFQALKQLDVSRHWADEEIEQIATPSRYLDFDAGAVLLREGEIAEAFDIVIHGLVEASITLPGGAKEVTELLGPGDYYGILSMATSEPSFLEYTARSDVVLVRVSFECLQRILTAHPDRAAVLAATVKQRFDAAEQAREASRRHVPKRSFREISRRIEELIGRRG